MRLKLSTPDRVVYQGEIKGVTLPTENGSLNITDNHIPMVSSIQPGILKIIPFDWNHTGYVLSKNEILISVEKGMAFVDGKVIRIVTSSATTIPQESKANLEENKKTLEEHIRKLRAQGSIEEIERYLTKLQKINADISLKSMQMA